MTVLQMMDIRVWIRIVLAVGLVRASSHTHRFRGELDLALNLMRGCVWTEIELAVEMMEYRVGILSNPHRFGR